MLRQRHVVVMGCGMIKETFDFFLRAVARFTTEVQPMVPVHAMIGFGLSTNLVGEAKASAGRDQSRRRSAWPSIVLRAQRRMALRRSMRMPNL